MEKACNLELQPVFACPVGVSFLFFPKHAVTCFIRFYFSVCFKHFKLCFQACIAERSAGGFPAWNAAADTPPAVQSMTKSWAEMEGLGSVATLKGSYVTEPAPKC